jgi:sulfide:quinone oxidoreductase
LTKNLVVLGAGIGGLSVVKELDESGLDISDVDIAVVDEDFSHFMGFTLPWVMRGWRDRDSVPIRPSATALSEVRAITGTVEAINPAARTVALADGTDLAFDALIIATGARNAIDNIPGLRDAVYRCPVAPYEGSLLAADLLRDNGSRDDTEISIYSPEKHPMSSAGPYAGPELVELLRTNGIEFFGDHAVARIEPGRNEIHFHNGSSTVFDLLVFVPPHEPAVTLDEPGWISVDAATMQTRHPGIFAIGDTTAITSPSGRPLPKAAIFAKNGAKAAAVNALHYLGKTDTTTGLSGQGHCYIDTGNGQSALGQGDFFTTPHPAIHLSPPSQTLHHDKQDEEHDWRATWEHNAPKAG